MMRIRPFLRSLGIFVTWWLILSLNGHQGAPPTSQRAWS